MRGGGRPRLARLDAPELPAVILQRIFQPLGVRQIPRERWIDSGRTLGAGGNSRVDLVHDQAGNNYALKRTRFKPDPDDLARIRMKLAVFNRLTGLNHILLPLMCCYEAYPSPQGQYLGDFLELYPECQSYTAPARPLDPVYLNTHIYRVMDSLNRMHQRSVAHLDFKLDNLMYGTGVNSQEIILTDLGESQIYDGVLPVIYPISTTTSIISESPIVWRIMSGLAEHKIEFIGAMIGATRSLIMIDYLMLGIFLHEKLERLYVEAGLEIRNLDMIKHASLELICFALENIIDEIQMTPQIRAARLEVPIFDERFVVTEIKTRSILGHRPSLDAILILLRRLFFSVEPAPVGV